jgi:hypothetical protein
MPVLTVMRDLEPGLRLQVVLASVGHLLASLPVRAWVCVRRARALHVVRCYTTRVQVVSSNHSTRSEQAYERLPARLPACCARAPR